MVDAAGAHAHLHQRADCDGIFADRRRSRAPAPGSALARDPRHLSRHRLDARAARAPRHSAAHRAGIRALGAISERVQQVSVLPYSTQADGAPCDDRRSEHEAEGNG